jgi:cholesterol transport system auxiliary component
MISTVLRALGATALVLLASGCADLPFNRPPAELFVLSSKNTFDRSLPEATWQLSIDVPIAEAGINTSRIAVRRTPLRLNYFEGVNWSDIAPRMIQTLMVESFENSERIIGVGRQNISLRADYSLVTELREFQAETVPGRPAQVRVRLNAKLIRLPQRIIISGANPEAVVTIKGEGIDNIVAAYDEALGRVLKKTVSWTLKAGSADFGNSGRSSRPPVRRRP